MPPAAAAREPGIALPMNRHSLSRRTPGDLNQPRNFRRQQHLAHVPSGQQPGNGSPWATDWRRLATGSARPSATGGARRRQARRCTQGKFSVVLSPRPCLRMQTATGAAHPRMAVQSGTNAAAWPRQAAPCPLRTPARQPFRPKPGKSQARFLQPQCDTFRRHNAGVGMQP